ncbi:hypothetical protein I7I50_06547 [Histoplasma capsulatum G186AR]|uniref:Uncharacterized protein n=1 Tax=Ajellomyces capsulatus TaxID=5037 RepID=A0A8H8D347_AJECA|nr:hypothetical protein I7I52_10381 [Histoplasma capsulatum]QSS67456.1 hypothetical protein I7I50_06547 [Histoplasma capsulatum G186AR]
MFQPSVQPTSVSFLPGCAMYSTCTAGAMKLICWWRRGKYQEKCNRPKCLPRDVLTGFLRQRMKALRQVHDSLALDSAKRSVIIKKIFIFYFLFIIFIFILFYFHSIVIFGYLFIYLFQLRGRDMCLTRERSLWRSVKPPCQALNLRRLETIPGELEGRWATS